ncbi:hypothetical protein M0R45_038238 [Rubus argutus]|uniref:Uncharacterized protein n=1 Tax=Rubus argutus TaxID=59490 RepID=A0AAW1W1S7_RUBAR
MAFFMGLENEGPVLGSKGTENQDIPGNTVVANGGSNRTVLLTGLKNERPVLTGEKDMVICKEAFTGNEDGNEIIQPKGKRGRPKGLKHKKSASGNEIREVPREIMGAMSAGNQTDHMSLGNGRSNLAGKEDGDGGIPMETSVAIEVGNESVQVKKKRGRPKGGSKTKKKDLAVADDQGLPTMLWAVMKVLPRLFQQVSKMVGLNLQESKLWECLVKSIVGMTSKQRMSVAD